jgi:hypothetical protein
LISILEFCKKKETMKTTFAFLSILLFVSFSLQSQIIHVPQDQLTIQAAIDAAMDHDTVLVTQGEYFENINFIGKNIVVCSNFALTNDPNDVISTIINGSMPLHADTGSCVLIVSGEDSTAVLQGFTLTEGTGTRWEDEHNLNHWYTEGGGILIQYSSPTVKNNIITGNEAINASAGITSAGGGAIRSGDSNPHILNNVISYNQGRYGGGIVLNYSGAIIKNNIITDNSGGEDYGGGGLWFLSNGEKPIICENNTITNNSSASSGGGIRLWSCSAILTNNIFWANTANSSSQIRGSSTVTYCCVEGGYNGEGNIDVDPEFIAEFFILSDGSACSDAGSPDVFYNDPEDPSNPGYALYPAKGSLHSDIGVYGGIGCATLPDIITALEPSLEQSQAIEVNIFPNPANTKLSIEIKADHENIVEVKIHDSNSVIKKTSSEYISNNNKFEYDISKLSPGVYFLTIRLKDEVKAYKFIKI